MKNRKWCLSNEIVYVVYIQENLADEWKKWVDTSDLAHLAKTNTMCVARYFVLKETLKGEVC